MGAFCVFGVSRSICRAKAEKKVSTIIGAGEGRRYLTIEEWAVKVREKSEEFFLNDERLVKISPEFDAPQFCRDWIAVSPQEVRSAKIMVRGPKKDESGVVITRNGAPVMTWLDYEAAA